MTVLPLARAKAAAKSLSCPSELTDDDWIEINAEFYRRFPDCIGEDEFNDACYEDLVKMRTGVPLARALDKGPPRCQRDGL